MSWIPAVPCVRMSRASDNHRKHTMGSVADKIAKKILSSRGSKVVDPASWREGKKMALEAGFGDEGPIPGRFADLDPCHAVYALAENVASLMAESISGMREAKGCVRIAGDAEDEYMPSGPPMSPLTVSYFTMWALFGIRFGSSRETMGSCILRVAPEIDSPSWLIDAVERMQRSRMGFYVNCGSEGDGVLLREVRACARSLSMGGVRGRKSAATSGRWTDPVLSRQGCALVAPACIRSGQAANRQRRRGNVSTTSICPLRS